MTVPKKGSTPSFTATRVPTNVYSHSSSLSSTSMFVALAAVAMGKSMDEAGEAIVADTYTSVGFFLTLFVVGVSQCDDLSNAL